MITTEQPVMVDLLTAAEMAVALMRQHNLTTGSIEINPGWPKARRWNSQTGDMSRPVLTSVRLHMSNPVAFLTWCEHLNMDRIHVRRRDMDTCLNANIDRDGLCWMVGSSLRRPYDGKHLPGIAVDWRRQPSGRRGNDAWITLPDLRATFAALGVGGGDAS